MNNEKLIALVDALQAEIANIREDTKRKAVRVPICDRPFLYGNEVMPWACATQRTYDDMIKAGIYLNQPYLNGKNHFTFLKTDVQKYMMRYAGEVIE